jgi:cold shock CspA family protein
MSEHSEVVAGCILERNRTFFGNLPYIIIEHNQSDLFIYISQIPPEDRSYLQENAVVIADVILHDSEEGPYAVAVNIITVENYFHF